MSLPRWRGKWYPRRGAVKSEDTEKKQVHLVGKVQKWLEFGVKEREWNKGRLEKVGVHHEGHVETLDLVLKIKRRHQGFKPWKGGRLEAERDTRLKKPGKT
jgi:hypothetical protein